MTRYTDTDVMHSAYAVSGVIELADRRAIDSSFAILPQLRPWRCNPSIVSWANKVRGFGWQVMRFRRYLLRPAWPKHGYPPSMRPTEGDTLVFFNLTCW